MRCAAGMREDLTWTNCKAEREALGQTAREDAVRQTERAREQHGMSHGAALRHGQRGNQEAEAGLGVSRELKSGAADASWG